MINRITLLGNTGSDPDIKYTGSGQAIANVTLATYRRWKNDKGEKQEATEWHRVVFFGKLAEVVRDYVKKGQQIYIEGRIQTRSWDKDGQKHYTTEIIATEMHMLGRKDEFVEQQAKMQTSHHEKKANGYAPNDDFNDDIPF